MTRKKHPQTPPIKPLDNRACLFCRVSSDSQNPQRQLDDLRAFASARKWDIVSEISETISGVIDNDSRDGVIELLERATKQEFSRVVCTELSRLGRNTIQVLTLLETLKNLGVSVCIQTLGIETLLDSGKDNPVSGLLCGILSQVSSIERTWIKERQASGIKRAKSEGKILGRRKGSVESVSVFLQKHSKAVKLLKSNMSIRNTATLCNTAPATIFKVKKYLTNMKGGEGQN